MQKRVVKDYRGSVTELDGAVAVDRIGVVRKSKFE